MYCFEHICPGMSNELFICPQAVRASRLIIQPYQEFPVNLRRLRASAQCWRSQWISGKKNVTLSNNIRRLVCDNLILSLQIENTYLTKITSAKSSLGISRGWGAAELRISGLSLMQRRKTSSKTTLFLMDICSQLYASYCILFCSTVRQRRLDNLITDEN